MVTKKLVGCAGLLVVGIVASVVTGCGSTAALPADHDTARKALDRALAAWQEGKPPESLRDEQPPIVINDHVWSKGGRLVRYEVEGDGKLVGADQRFQVVLWLRGDKGKDKKQMTEYNVGTNPILTVIRPF